MEGLNERVHWLEEFRGGLSEVRSDSLVRLNQNDPKKRYAIHELLLNLLFLSGGVENSLDAQLAAAVASKPWRGSTAQNDQTVLLLRFAAAPQKR